MRVVLDTNVIVSGAISVLSPPGEILHAWDLRLFELLVSPDLLSEYRRALGYEHVRRFHGLTHREIDELVRDYEVGARLVHPEVSVTAVVDDPNDNHVLECAEAGAATHIVSGDRHLRALGAYKDIPILEPRAFHTLISDLLDPRQRE